MESNHTTKDKLDRMNHEPIMKSCPKFYTCSAPICPLESVYPSKHRYSLKDELRCSLPKRKRYILGSRLKHHGLFLREANSLQSYVKATSPFSS